MKHDKLNISIIQTSLFWEDVSKNLEWFEQKIQACPTETDIIVLPEMFTTGFSMHAAHLAEIHNGKTINKLKQWASTHNCMFMGSYIAIENNQLFNRGFAVLPNHDAFYYDKKHLFTMSGEDKVFTSGNQHTTISFNGWNIALFICYDLRFPVWLRNINNHYDILVLVANWPESRKDAFNTLLKARAIENSCYVCASNRIGIDGYGTQFSGNAQIIDYKGNILAMGTEHTDDIVSYSINKKSLDEFRQKFPVWKDADQFTLY